MTNQPEQPFGGVEYPSLEQSGPTRDPFAPVDYPTTYPPVPAYPSPPGYPPPYPAHPAPYPPPYQGYPAAPYDPYAMGRPPGTNGKAIASLVTSLIGPFFCGLTSIAAVILGIIAMRETKRTGQDGFGVALAGTIIGALLVVLLLGYFLLIAIIAAHSVSAT